MVQKKKNILQETVSLKKNWLVVSTHLKNISQNKNLPQIGMKIRKIETTDPILENDDLQLFQLLQPFELWWSKQYDQPCCFTRDLSCCQLLLPHAHEMNGLSEKTIILVGIYNQQFQGAYFNGLWLAGLLCVFLLSMGWCFWIGFPMFIEEFSKSLLEWSIGPKIGTPSSPIFKYI